MGEGFRGSHHIISQCSHGHRPMMHAERVEQIPLGFLPFMNHPVLLFTNHKGEVWLAMQQKLSYAKRQSDGK